MANQKLVEFIKEARKRGFGDFDIRKALADHGWPPQEVEKAIVFLAPRYHNKNQLTLFLSDELLEALEKRAKKNMCTIPEQIEDILRRSTISSKKKATAIDSKLDDALASIFSRRKTTKKAK